MERIKAHADVRPRSLSCCSEIIRHRSALYVADGQFVIGPPPFAFLGDQSFLATPCNPVEFGLAIVFRNTPFGGQLPGGPAGRRRGTARCERGNAPSSDASALLASIGASRQTLLVRR
ncbi:MAG TPA: hypothetical protein VFC21_03145, partial [Bryobacteraceae bacterium]|nr:hypothetical protein [Bryobacteraceae bacterium]